MQPKRKRAVALAAMLVGVAGLLGAGFVAGRYVESPSQAAADAKAPELTLLTAPVEERVLTTSVVLRGTVQSERNVDITPSAPSADTQPIVTRVPLNIGDQVGLGQLIVEVAGRPVLALAGAIPAYRDLRPGSVGPDVVQLQESLRALGFDPRESGTFGSRTKSALTSMYESIGYAPPSTGQADEQALAMGRKQIVSLERAVADSQIAVDEALTPEEQKAAQRNLDRAHEDLSSARQEQYALEQRSGAMLPLSEYTFLGAFPAHVVGTKATIGGPVVAPLISLGIGELTVVGSMPSATKDNVQPGLSARIYSEQLGFAADGLVRAVGAASSVDSSTSIPGLSISVAPAVPFEPGMVGRDMRIVVEVSSTGSAVLAVPISALYSSTEGSVHVRRVEEDGTRTDIEVTTGLDADGLVEVRSPVLAAGDRVIVGSSD